MARRRKTPPQEPFEASIEDLSHDGRGVARPDGKAVFIHGALPGERVVARLTERHRQFDEAETLEVLQASPERVEPRCPHFGTCGGCALQHLDAEAQIRHKQRTLEENLARIGQVEPAELWPPLVGPHWQYRRRARLSVRRVEKKGRVLVGFRERYGRFVADCRSCDILEPVFGQRLEKLSELVDSLDARRRIPQIEVAAGDEHAALVLRHLDPLSEQDRQRLEQFARAEGLGMYLQPKGPDSITPLWLPFEEMSYAFPDQQLELRFGPANFIQINGAMNRAIANRMLDLLSLDKQSRVLDLFCGLGNFSLPLARHAGWVTGVEGDADLVRQATDNARRNGLDNTRFHCADLNLDPGQSPWIEPGYTHVVLDPPRSGAENLLPHLAKLQASTLLYISCHPGSLARDAGILVREHGFRLEGAGVMDMFPHTAHVESMALFSRSQ